MKLMVSAKPFTAELKSVLPAVATRSGLPMLSGVRLEASDGGVSIEATDLELTARRVVTGDVMIEGAGSVVVPAKALIKAVAAMGEPEIVLESDSSDGRAGLDVRAGTRTVTLQGWPIDDWPAVPRQAAIAPIASIDRFDGLSQPRTVLRSEPCSKADSTASTFGSRASRIPSARYESVSPSKKVVPGQAAGRPGCRLEPPPASR